LTVTSDETALTLHVAGQEKAFSRAASGAAVEIFVGLAGTAARFLTALCAAAPRGVYRLDGVPQMRKRPMKPLIDALRALGADVRCTREEGFFPLEIHAAGLRGGTVNLDASESSQLLSALLMVAPFAREAITIELTSGVRWSFVAMTLRLMGEFGFHVPTAPAEVFSIPPGRYRSPGTYAVEPDATAASYFLTLPVVVGGSLTLPGLRSPGHGLQGDSAFADVLARAHAHQAGTPLIEDFHEISDTFLTLAAIAPLLERPTRITGIAHTRKQETDRVAGMARELTRLGQEVVETHDALEIRPRPIPLDRVTEIETYGDHRFAMSFGILGCKDLRGDGQPWLAIKDPGCCAKTFPHFFALLDSVRQKSLAN
jgi:3-phosphoshikimate 1-carboxyvinyltransferase